MARWTKPGEHDPEDNVDHFKIWKTSDRPAKKGFYFLVDQFHEEAGKALRAKPVQIEWLANPVEKTVGDATYPIRREAVHLTGWKLTFDPAAAAPGGHVLILNQFTKGKGEDGGDEVKWVLGAPEYLLLPALKSEKSDQLPEGQPPEREIDHFLCYPVVAKPLDVNVVLVDQLDKWLKREDPERHTGREDITRLTPKFLAVPVEKTETKPHRAPRYVHKVDHLAIYSLEPQSVFNGVVATKDQFAELKDLGVGKSIYLAVPSLKTWKPPGGKPGTPRG